MNTDVQSALKTLRRFEAVIEREEVLAYSLVLALVDHWPSRVDAATRDLLHATRVIAAREPGRVIKQRRMAIWVLSAAENL